MKVAVIYNKQQDVEGVINVFGMQNQETYNPKTVESVAASLEKGGHNVRIVDGNINVIEQLEAFMPRVVQGEQPGMVFNMAYGIQGRQPLHAYPVFIGNGRHPLRRVQPCRTRHRS